MIHEAHLKNSWGCIISLQLYRPVASFRREENPAAHIWQLGDARSAPPKGSPGGKFHKYTTILMHGGHNEL